MNNYIKDKLKNKKRDNQKIARIIVIILLAFYTITSIFSCITFVDYVANAESDYLYENELIAGTVVEYNDFTKDFVLSCKSDLPIAQRSYFMLRFYTYAYVNGSSTLTSLSLGGFEHSEPYIEDNVVYDNGNLAYCTTSDGHDFVSNGDNTNGFMTFTINNNFWQQYELAIARDLVMGISSSDSYELTYSIYYEFVNQQSGYNWVVYYPSNTPATPPVEHLELLEFYNFSHIPTDNDIVFDFDYDFSGYFLNLNNNYYVQNYYGEYFHNYFIIPFDTIRFVKKYFNLPISQDYYVEIIFNYDTIEKRFAFNFEAYPYNCFYFTDFDDSTDLYAFFDSNFSNGLDYFEDIDVVSFIRSYIDVGLDNQYLLDTILNYNDNYNELELTYQDLYSSYQQLLNDYYQDISVRLQIEYNKGYTNGFQMGQKTSELYEDLFDKDLDGNISFLDFLGGVIDAPIQVISQMLNFEFLGTNLQSFFYAIVTIAVILFIVKLFI